MKKLLLILTLLPLLLFGKTIELNENNTISFNQAFTGTYVAQKQVESIGLCMQNIDKEIYVVLYSPGGSISAGQMFIDTLNALPCTFHTISLTAASMAYQTVQNLGTRYVVPSALLMSHRAQISGLSGELGGDLNEVIKMLEDSVTELEEVASKRVGISLEKYRALIADELWLTAKKAVKTNHADEVVNVVCHKSLLGTRVETMRTFFGNIDVEFSNCPIIVSPLRVVQNNTMKTDKTFLEYFNNISNRIEFSL